MEKNQLILTVSFQLENVPFNIKSYRFECNDCNCFLFCKKYGLFNGFIFLIIKKFLLSYFPNFHGQRSGGEGGGRDLSI